MQVRQEWDVPLPDNEQRRVVKVIGLDEGTQAWTAGVTLGAVVEQIDDVHVSTVAMEQVHSLLARRPVVITFSGQAAGGGSLQLEPEPEPEPTPAGRRGGGGGILATSSAMLSQHAGAASGPSASYIYSERGSAATAPPHTRENTISNPPGGGGSSRLRPGLEIELPGRASRDSSSVAAGDIRSRALAPAGQSAGVLTVPHLQRAGHPMPSAITAVHTMRSGNLDHSHPVADTTEAEPPAAAPRPQLGGSGSHMALAGAAQGLAGAITTAHAMRSSLDHSHPLADTTTATGDFFEL